MRNSFQPKSIRVICKNSLTEQQAVHKPPLRDDRRAEAPADRRDHAGIGEDFVSNERIGVQAPEALGFKQLGSGRLPAAHASRDP